MTTRLLLICGVSIYLVFSVATYGVFAFSSTQSTGLLSGLANLGGSTMVPSEDPLEREEGLRLEIDPSAPKIVACPLNGKMYTQVEADSWNTRRPLGVMIENSLDARPQSGMGSADVVYEAVSEGGITRFLAIYYCEAQKKEVVIAPVRSARQFFVDMISEYNRGLYAHVGGANGEDSDPRTRALENIASYGWNLTTSLNQFSIGFPTFVRNYNRLPGRDVATEHTMESSSEKLWAVAEKRGWTNVSPPTTVRGVTTPGSEWIDGFTPWKFQDGAGPNDRGSVTNIKHEFWSGYKAYAVEWNYDSATNQYLRVMGGQIHLDLNTNKQIAVNNVIVLQTREFPSVDIHKHNYLVTTGSGKAWIFRDGKVIEANWAKKSREDRTIFTDTLGAEISLTRGPIWISVINLETTPTY